MNATMANGWAAASGGGWQVALAVGVACGVAAAMTLVACRLARRWPGDDVDGHRAWVRMTLRDLADRRRKEKRAVAVLLACVRALLDDEAGGDDDTERRGSDDEETS